MTIDSAILALSPVHYWPCDETTGNTLTDIINSAILTVNDTLIGGGTASIDAGTDTYGGGFTLPVQSVDAANTVSIDPVLYGGDSEISFDVLDPASGSFSVFFYMKHPGYLTGVPAVDGTLSFQNLSDMSNAKILIKVDGLASSAAGLMMSVDVTQGAGGNVSKVFPLVGTESGEGMFICIRGNASDIENTLTASINGIVNTPLQTTVTGSVFVDPGILDSIVINNVGSSASWDLSLLTTRNAFSFSKLALFNYELTDSQIAILLKDAFHIQAYDIEVAAKNAIYYNKLHDLNYSCPPQIGSGALVSQTYAVDPVSILLGANVDKKGQKFTAAGVPCMMANNTVSNLDILDTLKAWTISFVIHPITYVDTDGAYTSTISLHFASSTTVSADAGIRFHLKQSTSTGPVPPTIAIESGRGSTATIGKSEAWYQPSSPYSAMHIVAAFNGDNENLSDTNLKFYINGVLTLADATSNNAVSVSATGAVCDTLLVNMWSDNYSNASDSEFSIRNIAVFPTQLNISQVGELYAASVNETALFEMQESVSASDISEIIKYYVHCVINEAISITTSLNSKVTFNHKIYESVSAIDAITRVLERTIAESVSSADEVTVQLKLLGSIAEKIKAINVVSDKVVMRNLLVESISVVDSILQSNAFVISESVSATDMADTILRVYQSLLEAVNLEDSLQSSLIITAMIPEEITVSDSITAKQIFGILVSETVSVAGGFNSPSGEHYTFVLNTESKGVSEYTNYNFNSMSGEYAASTTGIYKLSGTNDSGVDIDATIRTALIDFGSSLEKQVPAAYLGLSSNGSMYLKTITTYRGKKIEHWYTVSQTRDAVDTIRVKIGKGVKSRYWQFELTNVSGSDFDLESFELLPLILRRRV